MKTWNDYKEYVRTVDPETAKDIKETEEVAAIVTAMVEQRNALGLSQRELAAMCGLPQSSVARIESCKTTPNGILDGFQTIIPTAAAVLSKKRQMLRLTQQEIADRAKITLRQYQRLESGERSILTCSFGSACRVIEALDMDVSKFYHGDYYLEELKTIEGK